MKPNHSVQLCTLEYPGNLSSHDVLTTSLSVPFNSIPKSKFEHTYSKFNRERVVWSEEGFSEYQALASKALNDALEFWDTPECIPLSCSLFSNLLVKSAKLVFDIKKTGGISRGKVSKKILVLEDSLRRAHRNWKKVGKPVDRTNPT